MDFKVRPDLTFDVIGLFESVFIELIQSKIVVGCIYKPPDSNVAEYTYVFDNLLSVVISHKELCYVAGDFNIDLLKTESHTPTADFVNCLFSHYFFRLLTNLLELPNSLQLSLIIFSLTLATITN